MSTFSFSETPSETDFVMPMLKKAHISLFGQDVYEILVSPVKSWKFKVLGTRGFISNYQ